MFDARECLLNDEGECIFVDCESGTPVEYEATLSWKEGALPEVCVHVGVDIWDTRTLGYDFKNAELKKRSPRSLGD